MQKWDKISNKTYYYACVKAPCTAVLGFQFAFELDIFQKRWL